MSKKEPRVYIVRKDPKHFYGNYKKHSIEIVEEDDGRWSAKVKTYDQRLIFGVNRSAHEIATLKDKIRFVLERASLWSPDKELKLVRKKKTTKGRSNMLMKIPYLIQHALSRYIFVLPFNGWEASLGLQVEATPGQLADRFRELAETLEAQAKENGEFAPEELDTPPPQG